MKTLLSIFACIFLCCYCLIAQEDDTNPENMIDGNQNSIYLANDFFLTLSANYEYLYHLSEKANVGLRTGVGRDYGNLGYVAIGEALFVTGKKRHYFETGFAYHYTFYNDEGDLDDPIWAIMVGYRFQGYNGILFKVYPEYLGGFDDWIHFFLGFSLGYTF